MRILTRYVLKEYCVPLMYCLTGFVSIYLLFELFGSFNRLMEAKPGFAQTFLYFAGYLAPYFEWMAPGCLMLATLYTMWNFCRHSELIAMRANGIGFFTIVKPLLGVALLMAMFVFWINESFVPAKAQWAKQFKNAKFQQEEMELADNIVYHNAIAGRTWKVGALMTDDATAMEEVSITVDYPSGDRKMTIRSPRAEYLDGQWMFLYPSVTYFDEQGAEIPSPTPQLESLTLRSFNGFNEDPRDFLLQNRDWAYYSILDRIRYLETHPSLSEESRRDYEYDLWAQMVAPLACVIITLFAIPAGIASGRQSVFKGIVGALGMFFAFYGLTILFMVFAKKNWCAPMAAAILPDIIFFIIGLVMFWRHR